MYPNIIYDEYYYLLAGLHLFTLEFLAPVATQGHSTSLVIKLIAEP
jgi:hypothetical protein